MTDEQFRQLLISALHDIATAIREVNDEHQ